MPHSAVVCRCEPDLPVASAPLWQLEQMVAAVNVLWSTLAPVQRLVLWQETQLAVVGTCVVGLPVAWVPL